MHHLGVTTKFDNANQRFAISLTHRRLAHLMNKPADSHEIRDFGSLTVISGRYVGDVL